MDNVAVPTFSGAVTISGFRSGVYIVDRWNTSTGLVVHSDEIDCNDGSIVVSISNLVSDEAYKIYPKPAKIDLRILVPSADVMPGQIITITVEYKNNSQTDASNVSVSACVPAEMEYVTGSAEESGGTWSVGSDMITWVIGQIAAGETGTRTFRARVK